VITTVGDFAPRVAEARARAGNNFGRGFRADKNSDLLTPESSTAAPSSSTIWAVSSRIMAMRLNVSTVRGLKRVACICAVVGATLDPLRAPA
jgi:hypothetical protein